MKAKTSNCHIDFAVASNEIKYCVVCGEVPPEGGWWDHVRVTPAGPHPVGGLVGLCSRCRTYEFYRLGPKKLTDRICSRWRKTAPPFIPIVPNAPIQLVVRGCCNDEALAVTIRDTLDRVPVRSRQKIMDYVLTENSCFRTGKGMRFESLGRWPGMGECVGMNMDGGHAIRLRASFVRKADVQDLTSTIAHELAHTEQKAEGLMFDWDNECERDVEERLKRWGFDGSATESGKKTMLESFDSIIRLAKKGKAAIYHTKLPSGNYAAEAIRQAEKAETAVIRACERWRGWKRDRWLGRPSP